MSSTVVTLSTADPEGREGLREEEGALVTTGGAPLEAHSSFTLITIKMGEVSKLVLMKMCLRSRQRKQLPNHSVVSTSGSSRSFSREAILAHLRCSGVRTPGCDPSYPSAEGLSPTHSPDSG